MEFPVIEAVISSMVVIYIIETYLDIRQYSLLKGPVNFPWLLTSEQEYRRSSKYQKKKSHLRFVHEATTTIIDIMILLYNVLPSLWKRSGDFVLYMGFNAENEMLQSLAFLAATCFWTEIYELPFSLYSTFVIEASQGCSNQTFWQFVEEWFLRLCLSGLLGAPISAAALLVVQKGGPFLSLYLWIFSFVMAVALAIVYPHLIAFSNKFTPLSNGELRNKIKALASNLKYPLEEIFFVKGSTRTAHSSAYMYGIWKKNIVLDNTLLEQCNNKDEIIAIIAHEMGHWWFNHTAPSFMAVQVLSLLQFILFDIVRQSSTLFQGFGFDTQPIIIGFYIFQHVVMPAKCLMSFIMNLLSRGAEFEADAFVKNLGYGQALKDGLIRLQEQNLCAVELDPWYSAYHYSHPPLQDRLTQLLLLDNKSQ